MKKKEYESPNLELVKVLITSNLLVDSTPENDGSGEGGEGPGEF